MNIKAAKILAVDDEEMILDLFKRILEPEGYELITTRNAKDVLSLLEQHEPDLVLLDIIMPEISGIQVLDLIRRKSNVPVLMVTASKDTASLHDSLSIGADDYIRKPFHKKELLARIKTKLRRASI